MDRQYYVYIMTHAPRGTLYIGMTNDLMRRVYEHRNCVIDGFTKDYKVDQLAYFEVHTDVNEAIHREKQLKCWNRDWKLDLVESKNPTWRDLWYDIAGT